MPHNIVYESVLREKQRQLSNRSSEQLKLLKEIESINVNEELDNVLDAFYIHDKIEKAAEQRSEEFRITMEKFRKKIRKDKPSENSIYLKPVFKFQSPVTTLQTPKLTGLTSVESSCSTGNKLGNLQFRSFKPVENKKRESQHRPRHSGSVDLTPSTPAGGLEMFSD